MKKVRNFALAFERKRLENATQEHIERFTIDKVVQEQEVKEDGAQSFELERASGGFLCSSQFKA